MYLDTLRINMEKIVLDYLGIGNLLLRKWQTTEIKEGLPLDVLQQE